jgi:hypothetical protein
LHSRERFCPLWHTLNRRQWWPTLPAVYDAEDGSHHDEKKNDAAQEQWGQYPRLSLVISGRLRVKGM